MLHTLALLINSTEAGILLCGMALAMPSLVIVVNAPSILINKKDLLSYHDTENFFIQVYTLPTIPSLTISCLHALMYSEQTLILSISTSFS